jgi:hypothetical protein
MSWAGSARRHATSTKLLPVFMRGSEKTLIGIENEHCELVRLAWLPHFRIYLRRYVWTILELCDVSIFWTLMHVQLANTKKSMHGFFNVLTDCSRFRFIVESMAPLLAGRTHQLCRRLTT